MQTDIVINIGNQDLEQSQSWVKTPSINSKLEQALPIIQDAIRGLTSIDKKFTADATGWSWNKDKAIQEDAGVLKHHIDALNVIKTLSEAERKQLVPQLCTVYKILDVLKTNKYLDSNSTQQVILAFNQIQHHCFGFGNELCQIHSLISTAARLFDESKPADHLLDAMDGTSAALVLKSKATNIHSENTYKLLTKIHSYLKQEHIIKHLSVDDLVKLKALACWMMANYIKVQEQRLDLVEHIYSELREINLTVNASLAKREKDEFAEAKCQAAIASLFSLKDHLSSKIYFHDFWYVDKHVEELKNCKQYLKSLNSFIRDPDEKNIEGLIFLKKNPDAGIALYEVPSQKERKNLIVFSYAREGVMSYYNYLQSRSSKLGIGGLGHAPVYDAAEKCWEPLKEMLKECNYSENNIDQIITAGFGIDGAVAQVQSFLLAKEYPKIQTRTYSMGVAPYLDVNAAVNVHKQPNHYAINIILKDDTSLGVSKFSSYVAKAYKTDNFHGQFEAHNRDWFMSDITGHDRNIYADKAEPAIQQPIEMHALYHELDRMAKKIADKEVAAEALYEVMKPSN